MYSLFINSLVFRLYRKPPKYDSQLSFKARSVIKYAVFFHFAFGFYMYTNAAIFTYKEDNYSFLS